MFFGRHWKIIIDRNARQNIAGTLFTRCQGGGSRNREPARRVEKATRCQRKRITRSLLVPQQVVEPDESVCVVINCSKGWKRKKRMGARKSLNKIP